MPDEARLSAQLSTLDSATKHAMFAKTHQRELTDKNTFAPANPSAEYKTPPFGGREGPI